MRARTSLMGKMRLVITMTRTTATKSSTRTSTRKSTATKKYEALMEQQFEIPEFGNVNWGKFDYYNHQQRIKKTNERIHQFKVFASISISVIIALLVFSIFVFLRFGLGVEI